MLRLLKLSFFSDTGRMVTRFFLSVSSVEKFVLRKGIHDFYFNGWHHIIV